MKKLKKMKDETLVQVFSALGLYCGEFLWPTECLNLLFELNNNKKGNYLTFK